MRTTSDTTARRTASALAAVAVCFLLLALSLVQLRYVGVTMGLIPTVHVSANAVAPSETLSNGTVVAEYCSEAASVGGPAGLDVAAGRTSTPLSFDDAWFAQDARAYQHDLATACAVLTAVCNSESQYYSNVAGARPYVEQTLGALGFSDVRTESYAQRSDILDELGALFAGTHDVAAYTFASKAVPGPEGQPCTLIFVGIRGSYGVEWISNFNLADAGEGSGDHRGFAAAEEEVARALAAYASDVGANPAATRILITGHSRGGAIANLLAARLDHADGTAGELAPASGVYAYTFATPGCTRSAEHGNARYGNVFNVLNQADIVPQLPLSIWGYERYGTDVTLPSVSSAGFDALYGSMRRAFERNTGVKLSCDESTLAALDAFEDRASGVLPSADALASPTGIAGAVQTLLGTDAGAALMSHCPDSYIAWMQSVSGTSLSYDSPAAAR